MGGSFILSLYNCIEHKLCALMTPKLLSAANAPLPLRSGNRVLAPGPCSLVSDGRRSWN